MAELFNRFQVPGAWGRNPNLTLTGSLDARSPAELSKEYLQQARVSESILFSSAIGPERKWLYVPTQPHSACATTMQAQRALAVPLCVCSAIHARPCPLCHFLSPLAQNMRHFDGAARHVAARELL